MGFSVARKGQRSQGDLQDYLQEVHEQTRETIGQGEGTSGLVSAYESVCVRVMRLSSQDNPSSVL